MTNIHDPEAARENRQRLDAVWIRMTNDQRDALLKLAEHVQKLGPNAALILEYVASRLAFGVTYGDFSPERDYKRDRVEEVVDEGVYAVADWLKAQGKLRAVKPKSHPKAAE